jgi:putative FmdB family regulatory protein
MALYTYACPICGPFEGWRPVSLALADAACPHCGASSPRQISMPFLGLLSRENRIAHQRNERSADRPRVVGQQDLHTLGKPLGHAHSHAPSPYASVLGHAH